MKDLKNFIENATPANTLGAGDIIPPTEDSVGSDFAISDKKKKKKKKRKDEEE